MTLHDGRIVCNTCEDWRHDCEARHVVALDGKNARRQYLDDIEKKRGLQSRVALQNTIKALWPSR